MRRSRSAEAKVSALATDIRWLGRYYPAGTKPKAMLAHYVLN